jgi:hypothetical protein
MTRRAQPSTSTATTPPGGSTPPGSFTYEANDASVGDLDGDGQYEIVLKWNPTNAKDNAHAGYTGNTIIDAYKLDGKRLWRIDLGRNIRSGAHYTQFQVFDYDGDGRAEVVMKTADGTRSGTGQVIGSRCRLPQLQRVRAVRPGVPDGVPWHRRRDPGHRELRSGAGQRLGPAPASSSTGRRRAAVTTAAGSPWTCGRAAPVRRSGPLLSEGCAAPRTAARSRPASRAR